MQNIMLQIIKNIKNSFLIIFTLFIFNHISAKEITNLSWKKVFTLAKNFLILEKQFRILH